MSLSRWPRIGFVGVWLLSTGCTALREIPPSQYEAVPERKHVRVVTSAGLEYEFDYVKVEADTLVGFRRRDVEGAFDEFATLRLPLEEISRLSARGVDWYRTGLIGGGAIAAVVAAGLNTLPKQDGRGSGGGRPERPPPE